MSNCNCSYTNSSFFVGSYLLTESIVIECVGVSIRPNYAALLLITSQGRLFDTHLLSIED